MPTLPHSYTPNTPVIGGGRLIVGVDGEGSPEHPWSIQFSITPGTGYTLLASDTAAVARFRDWVLANRDRIVLSIHFGLLNDFAQFRAMGIDVFRDGIPFLDTSILAYNLCIEPQGLKALAYRHCGLHQMDYSEVIGDVGTQLALDYLLRVQAAADAPEVIIPSPAPKLPKRRKKDTDEEYQARCQAVLDAVPPPQVVRQWPTPEPELVSEGNGVKVTRPQGVQKLVDRILADVSSGKVLKDGSLVDPRERWSKLNPKAKECVIAAIGDMPGPTLDHIPFERAIRYSSRDADCQLQITRPLLDLVHSMDLDEVARMDHAILPMVERAQRTGIRLAPPEFWDKLETDCYRQMDAAKYKIWELTGREINPQSGDQVAALLYGRVEDGGLGLVPPMLTDGGTTGKVRGSTNDKCLENLLPQSPVCEYVMDYREADKVRGTYVVPLRELARGGDGRAHTTFKLTRVHTGRLAAENPNLLAIPVRSTLGAQCRHGFVASPGMVMFDADLGMIEMCTFAHLSQDKRLCQIIREGKDVHTMTASNMFSIHESEVAKFQRQAAKAVGFGVINGISAKGLLNQMILARATRADGSRWTEDECQQLLDNWFEIYPGAKRFQVACMEETRRTGLARDSLSGRIRYLPQIWSPDRTVREETERCSYSHLIQTSANTILKRAMKVMWDGLKDVDGVTGLLFVHDEVLVELPDTDEHRAIVEGVVQDAFTQTTKLSVPITADGKFGYSWGTAH